MTGYRITLHSPMGPRSGFLELPPGNGWARVTLLHRQSHLLVKRDDSGSCRLIGQLDSVMGPVSFEAELFPACGEFDCIACTGKGAMRLTGKQLKGSETHID